MSSSSLNSSNSRTDKVKVRMSEPKTHRSNINRDLNSNTMSSNLSTNDINLYVSEDKQLKDDDCSSVKGHISTKLTGMEKQGSN